MKVQVLIIAMLACGLYAESCKINRNVPTYANRLKWGGLVLGDSEPFNSNGTMLESVSAALASLGRKINGQTADPATLNSWLKANGGYSGNNFVWDSVSKLGLKFKGVSTNQAEIIKAICSNLVVILNKPATFFSKGKHWALATGYNGMFQVIDTIDDLSNFPVREWATAVKALIYTF